MKVSYRKLAIWAAIAIVAAVILLQPVTQRGKYVYQIETISNTCTFDVYPQQNATVSGSTLTLVVPIQTPTPCYDVNGTVNFSGSDIFVNLQTEKRGQVCVDCIGEVVGKVTISNLDRGDYSVHVTAPDKSVTQQVKIE